MPRTPHLTKRFSKPHLSRLINGDIESPDQPQQNAKTTRLDHHLVENHPSYNRATLQKLIKDGSVTVNGTVVTKPNYKLRGSEAVELHVGAKATASAFSERVTSPRESHNSHSFERVGSPACQVQIMQGGEQKEGSSSFSRRRSIMSERRSSENEPERCDFDTARSRGSKKTLAVAFAPTIIYEDENVLVLNKPQGMLSMSKGNYNPEPTIEDHGLLVHRLDRLTSGIIILAKNESTRAFLQKQFQQRKVKKTYHAIVKGRPNPPHAIINIPLARNLSRPSTFQPDPTGREAITEYEVLSSNDKYSLVKLTPTTGRTHQLRVHLSHLGHPILGDPLYGPANTPNTPRLFLHATTLEITLKGGTRKTFTSPLPKEFQDVLKKS